MDWMFCYCSSLTCLNLQFKTQNVTSMNCMFCGCSSLLSLQIYFILCSNSSNNYQQSIFRQILTQKMLSLWNICCMDDVLCKKLIYLRLTLIKLTSHVCLTDVQIYLVVETRIKKLRIISGILNRWIHSSNIISNFDL